MSSIYLEEEEELSLNIMALIQYERVPFSCIKCSKSEEDENGVSLCKTLNCTGSADPQPIDEESESSVAYVADLQTEFSSCPVHFIIPDHYTFLDKYCYIQEFPHTMPTWEEVDARFWASYQLYKGLTNKYANSTKVVEEEEIKQKDNSKVFNHFNK